MKNRKALILSVVLACLMLCPVFVRAQKKLAGGMHDPIRDRFGTNTITVQGYPMIFHGYGLAYTRQLYKQHWVKVNGVCHYMNRPGQNRLSDIKAMLGGSVGVAHQYNYFELPDVGFRMFFQWGFNYSYLDLENVAKARNHIEKLGLEAALGFRQNIAKPLFFEFFIGYAHNWLLRNELDNSSVDPSVTDPFCATPTYNKTRYNRVDIFGYAHGGPTLVVGLNLGFLF